MEMVNIKINGMPLSVPAGSTILEAARYAGINIPTLCWMKDLNEIGACRICVVEVVRAKTLVTACVYPVNEGMEIYTNSPRVMKARKMTLELMLSTHDKKCLSCVRSENCELQKLCRDYGVEAVSYTHLDVYKRQVPHRGAGRGLWGLCGVPFPGDSEPAGNFWGSAYYGLAG